MPAETQTAVYSPIRPSQSSCTIQRMDIWFRFDGTPQIAQQSICQSKICTSGTMQLGNGMRYCGVVSIGSNSNPEGHSSLTIGACYMGDLHLRVSGEYVEGISIATILCQDLR